MAVVVIQEFEAPLEEYEQVSEKIGDGPPPGLIVHTVTDMGGDRWKLVDVWESAEDFQNFVQNTLIPAIAEVNPDAPQAPEESDGSPPSWAATTSPRPFPAAADGCCSPTWPFTATAGCRATSRW